MATKQQESDRATIVWMLEVLQRIFRQRMEVLEKSRRMARMPAGVRAEADRKFAELIRELRRREELPWENLAQVGLAGETLRWKAQLFFRALGREGFRMQGKWGTALLRWARKSFPTAGWGLGIRWRDVLRHGKNLLSSLKQAFLRDERIRLLVDFLEELMEIALIAQDGLDEEEREKKEKERETREEEQQRKEIEKKIREWRPRKTPVPQKEPA